MREVGHGRDRGSGWGVIVIGWAGRLFTLAGAPLFTHTIPDIEPTTTRSDKPPPTQCPALR